MVSLDIKKETASLLPLNASLQMGEEGNLSFSALLKGTQEKDKAIIQNGTLLMALEKEIPSAKPLKEEGTLSLENSTGIQNIEIDPKLTATLSSKELKVVIKEAKQFLKDKIIQSEGFKKAEIDALPKTLNGLVQVAKKIGIDISKITLEDIAVQTPKIKEIPKQKSEVSEIPLDTEIKKGKSRKIKPFDLAKVENNAQQSEREVPKKELSKHEQKIQQDIKSTPLFKAQNPRPEITTQQIVDTKTNSLSPQKISKQKTNDTLQLLLRGEKVSKKDTSLTADFSVATAKVIAPHASKEAEKSLESLLKKSTKDTDDVHVKTDGMNIAKADSFEVKLNEAKQMLKYLSQDVKSAIDDYKSPFTRVKVQLNPQRLGEIDLTVVQRGKNLHINLSSNNVAINTLAMNVNDLKVQLNNNGINNASFNFNSNSQSDNSQAGQQEQQRQQQQQADKEYNYFDSQERKEESVNSLEIIVPHYA